MTAFKISASGLNPRAAFFYATKEKIRFNIFLIPLRWFSENFFIGAVKGAGAVEAAIHCDLQHCTRRRQRKHFPRFFNAQIVKIVLKVHAYRFIEFLGKILTAITVFFA